MFKIDERYLCAYLCNKNLINKFNILMNFYNEIAAISLKTQNPQFMQIRIKWFMDAIVNLYKNIKSGFLPIDNISMLINENAIAKNDLLLLLQSRTLDRDYVPFNSENEYINYCKNTGGILWKLVMQVYGGNKQDQKAANLCGTIYAILGNIRNIKFDTKRLVYKLIFDKKVIIKGNNDIEIEIQNNILHLLNVTKEYFKRIDSININNKYKRLMLLNVFNENYYYLIKNNKGNYKNIDIYDINFKYKLKFIYKYLFNIF